MKTQRNVLTHCVKLFGVQEPTSSAFWDHTTKASQVSPYHICVSHIARANFNAVILFQIVRGTNCLPPLFGVRSV